MRFALLAAILSLHFPAAQVPAGEQPASQLPGSGGSTSQGSAVPRYAVQGRAEPSYAPQGPIYAPHGQAKPPAVRSLTPEERAAFELELMARRFREPTDSGCVARRVVLRETYPGSGETIEDFEDLTWKQAAGSTVSVEGIADGLALSKGYGPDLLIRNASIQVRFGHDDVSRGWQDGKLVRLVGVLERQIDLPPDPRLPPAQSEAPGLKYFIRPLRCEVIDRVERPYIRIVQPR